MEPHKEQDTELWDKNSTLILLYMDKYNIYIYIYIYIYLWLAHTSHGASHCTVNSERQQVWWGRTEHQILNREERDLKEEKYHMTSHDIA